MPVRGGRGDPGFYPERDTGRESPLDRLAAGLMARLGLVLARRLQPPPPLAGEVARHAARLREAPLAPQVPALRYRLRRDGLAGAGLAECFGMYAATLPEGGEEPASEVLAAAAALVGGGILELADAQRRWQALALAATAFALCGVPVHLYGAGERRAREAVSRLRGPLGALGLGVAAALPGMSAPERRVAYGAAVCCGTQRGFAFDYLHDRQLLGRRQRALQSRLERLSGDTTAGAPMPLLNGLHCALVEDADLVLVDDARTPLVLTADAGASPDRLPYEQALELASALQSGVDYVLEGATARLAAGGSQKLAQLSVLLGGLWSARQSREELVTAALVARHACERGRDYDVAQGLLQLPPAGPEGPALPAQLQRLLEAKEGIAFGGHREVLARLSVPQYFRRYLRLAGTCADARGLEGEFWSVYGLRCARAGWEGSDAALAARVFRGSAGRRAALLDAVQARSARGDAVLIAVRSAAEAGALAGALGQAGVRFGVLRGAGGEEERTTLEGLDQPGAVALSLFPAQRGAARAASAGVPLHLAVADLHDARRHVAQIAGAYAAASREQFLALEDEGVAARAGWLALRRARAGGRAGELAPAAARRFAAAAQRGVERAAARQRREQRAREQAQEELLAFSGRAQ